MLRVREDDIQELGVVGAVHVDGDRRLELEVLAPAGGAGLADVEGLGVLRLEPRVVVLGFCPSSVDLLRPREAVETSTRRIAARW